MGVSFIRDGKGGCGFLKHRYERSGCAVLSMEKRGWIWRSDVSDLLPDVMQGYDATLFHDVTQVRSRRRPTTTTR